WFEVLEDRLAPSVSPIHVYDFNGSYADLLGGQAIVADGGTLAAGRYTFQPNQGLRLSGALTDTANYSLVIVGQLDDLSTYYKKIVDFQNSGGIYSTFSDDGLYVSDASL